jgi:hypothetical protein
VTGPPASARNCAGKRSCNSFGQGVGAYLKLPFTRHSKSIYKLQVQAEYLFCGAIAGRWQLAREEVLGCGSDWRPRTEHEQPVHLRQPARFHLLRGPICFSHAKGFSTNQRFLRLIAQSDADSSVRRSHRSACMPRAASHSARAEC